MLSLEARRRSVNKEEEGPSLQGFFFSNVTSYSKKVADFMAGQQASQVKQAGQAKGHGTDRVGIVAGTQEQTTKLNHNTNTPHKSCV